MRPVRILALFTQTEGPGGVQRLARSMMAGLEAYVGQREGKLRAMALLDKQDAPGIDGFAGNRLAFSSAALRAARGSSLVFCNHPFIAPVAALAAKLAGVPLVVHAHGIEVWKPLSGMRRWALRNSRLVTCTSAFTRDQATIHQGLSKAGTAVLYPVLDHRFAASPASRHQEPMLLSVARLERGDREKCLHEALTAFADAGRDFPRWRLSIVGTGALLPSLQQLAKQLRIHERVDFLGRVSDEELQQLYHRASAFLLPSMKEGLGIVFLEAMQAGLPCIGGNAGGTPEIVHHGTNGWLVEPRNFAAFAAVLREAMGDSGRRAEYAQAARETASRFTQAAFNARMGECLASLLEGRA